MPSTPRTLTVQLHGAKGLVLQLQLREHDGVVSEVGAQHAVLQHAQGWGQEPQRVGPSDLPKALPAGQQPPSSALAPARPMPPSSVLVPARPVPHALLSMTDGQRHPGQLGSHRSHFLDPVPTGTEYKGPPPTHTTEGVLGSQLSVKGSRVLHPQDWRQTSGKMRSFRVLAHSYAEGSGWGPPLPNQNWTQPAGGLGTLQRTEGPELWPNAGREMEPAPTVASSLHGFSNTHPEFCLTNSITLRSHVSSLGKKGKGPSSARGPDSAPEGSTAPQARPASFSSGTWAPGTLLLAQLDPSEYPHQGASILKTAEHKPNTCAMVSARQDELVPTVTRK